jgi:hypothetical protein
MPWWQCLHHTMSYFHLNRAKLEELRDRLTDEAEYLRDRAHEYRRLAFTTSKATSRNLLAVAPTLDAAAEQLETQIQLVENVLRQML